MARNPEKTRRAARHPDRPGENCEAPPGRVRPVVDPRRCEGKGDCVAVCPYGVFTVEPIAVATYRSLPALARLRLWVHGKRTAHTPGADACRACGLCVVACPERAIVLTTAPAR